MNLGLSFLQGRRILMSRVPVEHLRVSRHSASVKSSLQLMELLTWPTQRSSFEQRVSPHPQVRQLCLGKLVVPFGQYENAPFHWLVANGMGYMKYVLDKHRSEVTNPQRKGEMMDQWVKDYLTEYAESFLQVSSLLEANNDRCIYGDVGSQYHTQKDRPDQFSDEQRVIIQKAYSSVRRWLHTPMTHITSVQMKRFKKYINDKEQQPQASTSKCGPSSWAGVDAELIAASQAVEDLLKSQESSSQTSSQSLDSQRRGSRPTDKTKQPKPADRPKQAASTSQPTETPSTTKGHDYPMEEPLTDSPVELEGWVRLW